MRRSEPPHVGCYFFNKLINGGQFAGAQKPGDGAGVTLVGFERRCHFVVGRALFYSHINARPHWRGAHQPFSRFLVVFAKRDA